MGGKAKARAVLPRLRLQLERREPRGPGGSSHGKQGSFWKDRLINDRL